MPNRKQIWAVDCETDPFEVGRIVEPFIWGVYHHYGKSKYYKEFVGSGVDYVCTSADIGNFVDFLSQQDIIVYAHNGGKFDWHFLSEYFEPSDDILIINGRLAKFVIGKCEFRDSYNIIPAALSQYNKQEFNYVRMSRLHRHKYMHEISEYLESDCKNLWDMVRDFELHYGRQITQASAAMNFWRGRLKTKSGVLIKNKVPRSKAVFYDLFRPYYYGGRTQCFESGDIKVQATSIDMKSAYTFGMLQKHPYGLDYYSKIGKPKKNYKKWGPMFFHIACVAKGAFPYNGVSGKRYYPDDDVERYYCITGWELLAAMETNTVKDIRLVEHFEFIKLKSFRRYVNHFYELRKQHPKETQPGQNLFAKLFMNSLYGKFAADPRKYKSYSLRPADAYAEFAGQSKYTVKLFREWCIIGESKESATGFYNVATAASITGYVRAMLWRALCTADRPFYCDTDSITAKSFGSNVVLGPELGQWEIENKYDRIVIAGRKLYAFHVAQPQVDNSQGNYSPANNSQWKIASKGARLTYKEIIRAAHGEAVMFNAKVPTFSVLKKEPTFINRVIRSTVEDIKTVPEKDDPLFQE